MKAVKFTLTFKEDEPVITASITLQHLDILVRQPILTSMETGHLTREEAIDAAAIMLDRDNREDAEAYLFDRDDELANYFNGFY